MIVLDASALADAVLDQPAAEWVLEQIAGEDVSSPAHQPAEMLSALSRLIRAGEIEPGTPPATGSTRRPRCRNDPSFPPLLTCGAPTYFASAPACWTACTSRSPTSSGALVTTDRRLATATAPCDVRIP